MTQIITTRITSLLSNAAETITAAVNQTQPDSTLAGLVRLTRERLATAQHLLAAQDHRAVQPPLIDAATTIEAFRRLVALSGHDQARALASLAGTYILDATEALAGAEVTA